MLATCVQGSVNSSSIGRFKQGCRVRLQSFATVHEHLLLRQRPAEMAQHLPVPILVAHVVAESPSPLKRDR